jgi:hypothetical protein
MDMARLTKSLSKNGTRASKPQADVDLFALKQSYKCRAFNCPWNREFSIRNIGTGEGNQQHGKLHQENYNIK